MTNAQFHRVARIDQSVIMSYEKYPTSNTSKADHTVVGHRLCEVSKSSVSHFFWFSIFGVRCSCGFRRATPASLTDGARLALRYNYRLNACRVTDSAVYISQGVMMESRKFDVISMGFVIAGHLIRLGGSAEACLAFVTLLEAANW